jgi:hypothetical protein
MSADSSTFYTEAHRNTVRNRDHVGVCVAWGFGVGAWVKSLPRARRRAMSRVPGSAEDLDDLL